jgi:hypothetical protein
MRSTLPAVALLLEFSAKQTVANIPFEAGAKKKLCHELARQ